MGTRFDDACAAAAATLIDAITSGAAGQWTVPWHTPGGLVPPTNANTGTTYRGGNWIIGALASFTNGWTSGQWATYKTWRALGRQVAKGQTGTAFVRWVEPKRTDDSTQPNDLDHRTPRRKLVPFVFNVFAAEQLTQDPDAKWQAPPVVPTGGLDPSQRHHDLDAWIAATGAEISLAGNRAYYLGADIDRIFLPPHDAWELWGDFYATAAHELVHWTGHESRLARPRVTRADLSDDALAFEELVAEFGAAMIGQHFGFAPSPRSDHASYLASWAQQFQADPRVLWRAASAAQNAVDHLLPDAAGPQAGKREPNRDRRHRP